MHFRVISLRTPGARLTMLVLGLLLAVWLINPRTVRASPKTTAPIPVYRVEMQKKAMALTINVVWGTEYVPHLLSTLRNEHVPATFMIGGAWAKAHPLLVKEMHRDGDEVGNHGWNHRHPNQLSYAENVKDIGETNREIQQTIGVSPVVYAPPYGEFNRTVLKASESLKMTLVMWTIDTIDWRPSSLTSYMVNKVLAHSLPGAIVLMHPTDRTVLALPQIIHGLQHQGYHLVTVTRLLSMGIARTDS